MVTATQTRDETMPMVSALVRLAHAGTGSKMTAYDAVGRRIGASGSWVRKFLGRQSVGIDGHVLDNIRSAYARVCDHLDAVADATAVENASLRGEIDAARHGPPAGLQRTDGTAAAAVAAPRRPGQAPAPALVRADAATGLPAHPAELNDLPLWRAANGEE